MKNKENEDVSEIPQETVDTFSLTQIDQEIWEDLNKVTCINCGDYYFETPKCIGPLGAHILVDK